MSHATAFPVLPTVQESKQSSYRKHFLSNSVNQLFVHIISLILVKNTKRKKLIPAPTNRKDTQETKRNWIWQNYLVGKPASNVSTPFKR